MKIDVNPESGPDQRATEIAPLFPETPETNTESVIDFKTPEQIAAGDDIVPPLPEVQPESTIQPAITSQPLTDSVESESSKPAQAKRNWKTLLALHWPPKRKEYIVLAVVILLLGGGAALASHNSPAPVATVVARPVVKKPVVVKPTTVPSTLSGLPVDPAVNNRPVTAVMVENSLDARPQSGLSAASVVFEAVAEGGVTRFMAVYQDTAPDDVGPIRSARPYYIAWSQGFDAGYAHVGGSPDGLADIKAWNVRDLDQFANGGSYHRITTRDAPHNVYTGITTLNQLETSKGYSSSKYSGFVRKTPAPSPTPTVKTIDLALSGYYYNAHFDYNAATNSYNRSEAGTAQTDQTTGQQLSPKVVVAMVTPLGQGELDASGAYYSNYSVIGSGAVYIFQDGSVTTGQWSKPTNTAQITFSDAAGKPIGLNPGQTWLTAVSSTGNVSYTP